MENISASLNKPISIYKTSSLMTKWMRKLNLTMSLMIAIGKVTLIMTILNKTLTMKERTITRTKMRECFIEINTQVRIVREASLMKSSCIGTIEKDAIEKRVLTLMYSTSLCDFETSYSLYKIWE